MRVLAGLFVLVVGCAQPAMTAEDYCENAERNGLDCSFCAPNGSALIRCGFCGDQPDVVETCGDGERCVEWTSAAETNWKQCRAALPTICADGQEDHCDGNVRVTCDHRGEEQRVDCSQTDKTCVESDFDGKARAECRSVTNVACDPAVTYRCDGNEEVYCADSGFEERVGCGTCLQIHEFRTLCLQDEFERCNPSVDAGHCTANGITYCEPASHKFDEPEVGYIIERPCVDANDVCVGTPLGPRCLPPRTAPCDPDTFEAFCDGSAIVNCSFEGWIDEWECGEESECREFDGDLHCSQLPFRPCTPGEPPRCDGDTGEKCFAGAWYRGPACDGLNPVCTPLEDETTCTFDDAQPCTPGDPNDAKSSYSATGPIAATPIRCESPTVLIGCDLDTHREVKLSCENSECNPGDLDACW